MTDALWARTHPDIQDVDSAYWINENNKLLHSNHWRQVSGTKAREVGVEMAKVREARRKRNESRRAGIGRARTGIHGIDPAAPPGIAVPPVPAAGGGRAAGGWLEII